MAIQLENVCSPKVHDVQRFTELSTKLVDLWSLLGENPELQNLDREFAGAWPNPVPRGFRSSFYVCREMLQLMENAYLELRLEETWDHPDSKGWKNMFMTWSKSVAIQKTWAITVDSYGLRFQYFCQRELQLPASKRNAAAAGA